MKTYSMFVNGEMTAAATAETETLVHPATEQPLAVVPYGSSEDVDRSSASRLVDSNAIVHSNMTRVFIATSDGEWGLDRPQRTPHRALGFRGARCIIWTGGFV